MFTHGELGKFVSPPLPPPLPSLSRSWNLKLIIDVIYMYKLSQVKDYTFSVSTGFFFFFGLDHVWLELEIIKGHEYTWKFKVIRNSHFPLAGGVLGLCFKWLDFLNSRKAVICKMHTRPRGDVFFCQTLFRLWLVTKMCQKSGLF